ncbi:MAG: aldolase [Planctomycetes bacterium]|jgi:fructose-bisphosphate aldolase/6-deoxy-5-ketofructose 1-phosphate synthase|nr:aldolase [Planctomycetota bacterium]
MKKETFIIPLSVPKAKQAEYRKNFKLATKNTGKLVLFAGDQKVEHLNSDFYNPNKDISPEDASPEHLFQIAAKAEIGVFAAQLGLIARYGMDYKKVPYIIKLNSRTNLVPGTQQDSYSANLAEVEDVVKFKKQSGLNIVGIGYTVYIGSEYEAKSLKHAASAVRQAHENGLLAIIWMYPRGKNISNEDDIHLIAGGAGVAACLGADFVKVKYPYDGTEETARRYREVVAAAGRTGVICVGGARQNETEFLKNINLQMNISGAKGLAIGRNLHQRSLIEAIKLAKEIADIVYRNKK